MISFRREMRETVVGKYDTKENLSLKFGIPSTMVISHLQKKKNVPSNISKASSSLKVLKMKVYRITFQV